MSTLSKAGFDCTWNQESTAWNPESNTVFYLLRGGDWPLTISLCTAGRLFPGSLWREGVVVHRLLTVNNLDDTTPSSWLTDWMTQTTLQTRKYIAPQGAEDRMTQTTLKTHKYIAPEGAEELCLTQFLHVSNETDRIFFLPTTSPFEWQSFPYQDNHFRRHLTIIRPDLKDDGMRLWSVTFVWTATVARLNVKRNFSAPCFRTVRRMGLSNWRTLRLRNQTDRQVCRVTTSLMNLLLVNWYRPSNRDLGSVFLRLSRLT